MLNAMDEAMGHFTQGMELLNSQPENKENQEQRVSLLVNMAFAFFQLYQYPEYRDVLARYESVAEKLENQRLLGSYWARVGHCQWWLGDSDKGLRSLNKAAEVCRASQYFEETAYVYLQMQWLHKLQARYDRVFSLHERALRIIEKQFRLRYYVWVETATAWSYACVGRWNNAIEAEQRAMSVARDFSDNSMISFAALIFCIIYTLKGELARAVEYGELAVQSAPTPADRAWSGMLLSFALCRSQMTQKGIEVLTGILPHTHGRGVLPEVMGTTTLGEGYWLAGDEENAKSTLELSCELSERFGLRYYHGWAHRILGEIALKTDLRKAKHHLEKSTTVLRDIKAENELALTYAAYGRFHKQQGNHGESRRYLIEALEIFERLGTLIEPEKVRKELAQLPDA